MATYTKRVQSVFTKEQYEMLVELSQTTGKPLSVLVREAVEEVYFEQRAHDCRQKALSRLLSLQAPVSDWSEMEEEIAEGASSS
jgi:predicted DNA-binding protein